MSYLTQTEKGKPASISAAVMINGSIIAAIMLSPMVVKPPPDIGEPPIGYAVTIKDPPPDDIDLPRADNPAPPTIDVFVPPVPPQVDDGGVELPFVDDGGSIDIGMHGSQSAGNNSGEVKDEPVVPPVPVFNPARRDPKYADDFQPAYPTRLLQREIEGSATIRVLIGTNGRVRQANIVFATHAGFGKAAAKQARKKWRFLPATRGGTPVEDWKTQTVKFLIDD